MRSDAELKGGKMQIIQTKRKHKYVTGFQITKFELN